MAHDLFIGGQWIDGAGEVFSSFDPATGDAVWRGAAASPQDVAHAMEAARAAFPAWARTPLDQRIEIARRYAKEIEKRADDLAKAVSREMGKPLWDSKGEVAAVINKVDISIRAQAERAGVKSETTAFGAASIAHRPHGVMAVFGPFNFPAHLPNGHIVPALLAGNTIVFKPSELAPSAAMIMGEAWEAARLPAGVLNIVQGGRETGAALLDHPDLNGVLFTGSAHTGLLIHRKFAGRPDVLLALEMGGNNPLIVWSPVDVNAAANLIAHSAWATSGQRCSCARRVILPEGKFGDDVVAALKSLGERTAVGAWDSSPEPFMGPVVSAHAAQHGEAFEKSLIALGGKSVLSLSRSGAFLKPGIVDMTGAREAPDEELFGPLAQIFRVRDLDEAFARANATRYGLSGGVISDDPAIWARAQQEMRAGVLNWNRPTTGASSALPFGGPGLSGNLRPSAAYAADYAAYPVATQSAEKAAAIPAQGLPK